MENQRVCYVEIESQTESGKKELKQLNGLALKGKVSRKMGSTQSEADISIANLAKEDVEYLTTFLSPYVKPKTRKRINVYAGYSLTGYGRIFSGDIEQALPSDLPDTWLNIKAKSLYYQNRTPLSYGVSGISSKDLAQSVANNLGLSFDWQASSTKTFNQFNYTGSHTGLIEQYNKLDDVTMFEDNGTLKVVDKIVKPPTGNNVKLISKNTGMIGLPEPDQYGVKVTCLLDASLNLGKWVRVESERLSAINGFYYIYTLDFDFSSREQPFYCHIYAKASGVK